jgi:23S rRNA (adenine2503-C2)-methyltransferase
MTNLPKALRAWLDATFTLMPASLVLNRQSADVTDKLLLELEDRSLIETVIIRAPQEGVGLDHSRKTICISTQVGCAMGCVFCASGLAGPQARPERRRDRGPAPPGLLPEDERTPRARAELASFDNIVVMGMGEPLANYDALMRALTIVNAEWGLGFGARRITISTSGLVPKILRLADEPLGFRLAISLHGATDEVRSRIMPVNKAYPLAEAPAGGQGLQRAARPDGHARVHPDRGRQRLPRAGAQAARHRARPARPREPDPLQHGRGPALAAARAGPPGKVRRRPARRRASP